MNFALPVVYALFCVPAWGAVYSITSVISETVGTTAIVTGSGSLANTTTWTAGVAGEFIVTDGTNDYGLRVAVTNPTGGLSEGTDSLMVARTVNSQGLADNGTLSIYIRPGTTGTWSADVRFSFYNLNGLAFGTPYSPSLLLTSLDIDFDQRYYTEDADFIQNNLYSPTNLTNATAVTGYTGFTAPGDATFSDPKSAVSSVGKVGVSEFDIRVSHNQVALFMFEFRDPSQVLVVPEPSTMVLSGLGAVFLLRRRRRS